MEKIGFGKCSQCGAQNNQCSCELEITSGNKCDAYDRCQSNHQTKCLNVVALGCTTPPQMKVRK